MDGSNQQAGGSNEVGSEVNFELAGGPYAVTAARLALTDLDNHVDSSLAFDVRLLVSELVTNSVQHAHVGPEDSIMLALRITDELVRVEVRDGGPGFDAPAAAPPRDADKGWGLFLVEQLADAWGVAEERKCVWFEIRRRADEAAPSVEHSADYRQAG